MKKIILTITGIVILFILLIFIVAFFLVNNGSFLTNFEFKNISNTGLNFYVYLENVKAAKSYDILVYDSENRIIYKDNIKDPSTTIEFDILNFNEVYKIVAIAYDKEGNKKSVKEPYTFLWDELTFSETNTPLMNNEEDYIIYFDGDYKKKDYKLNIKVNDVLLETVDINDEKYIIKNQEFKEKEMYYTLEIIDSSMVISTLKLYNLMSPINDIVITNPNEGDMKDYDDVAVSFTGGDNATNYILELYSGNKLIRKKEIKDKAVILSNNLFEKATNYKLKISALYQEHEEYKKSAEISFSINAKETLKPVYTNYNSKVIKNGTKIKLLTSDKDATIYYTIDGSDPTTNGIKYENEIIIKDNMTIKAVSKADKKNDSIVSTFDFKIGTKNNYKIYLSASNQNNNLGVSEVGYTNEKKEMNDLTNYIEKRLESYGVTTYRNEFGDINRWTADSTYLGVDLHLAIHSNASEEHTAYGIETWIHDQASNNYSLAQKIQNNLMSIYYKKDDELANRGVKYANGSLAEVNPAYTPCGILVEIAHHDYKDDAAWIVKNKERIGNNIADSILEYFQIK